MFKFLFDNQWFQKLKVKLKKSSQLFDGIFSLFGKSGDINYLELEEMLLNADFDYSLVSELIQKIKDTKIKTKTEARDLIENFLLEVLKPHYKQFDISFCEKPIAIMCSGINGSGKTTTIAKIAAMYQEYNPLMVACDTFRAAAIEQLDSWGKKINIEIFQDSLEKDPAAVAYKAIEHAKHHQKNLILIDTSGRLHNNANLMPELEKIERVIKKHNPLYPHESLLILDGTLGQSLKNQIESFSKYIKITGLVVTKLDGVSRCGILISLVHEFKIPVYFIGIGEKIEDINHFNPEEFVKVILGKN